MTALSLQSKKATSSAEMAAFHENCPIRSIQALNVAVFT
jgi:hypothetical protein